MKKDISEKIELPENVNAEFKDGLLVIKSEGKEQRQKINSKIEVKVSEKEIVIGCKKATKKEKKIINTIVAHTKNIILGFKNKYIYKLQVGYTHFPMNISVDKEKKELLIKNFLGESKPRKAGILNDTEVKVEKDIITVESFNKEAAGQTAANIESTTRIKKRDRRVFQDGIWIVSKPTKKTREGK